MVILSITGSMKK